MSDPQVTNHDPRAAQQLERIARAVRHHQVNGGPYPVEDVAWLLAEIDRLNEQLLEIDSALAEYADSQESGADAPDLIAMMWDRCCQLTSRAVERALEIDRLRTQHEQWHVDRTVMLDDLAAILRTLDLGDHARPQSAHEVMQGEVLPAVDRLVNQHAQLRVYYLAMNARIKQLEAQLGLREVSPVAPSHPEWCNCQAVPGTAAYPGPWHPRGDARHYSCSQDSDPPRVEVNESGLLEVSPDA